MNPPRCRVCGAVDGALHRLFCATERCPFCGGQLASCGCQATILGLSDDERAALEAYEDDTVKPLQGIVARWVRALERKGRVPFRAGPEAEES